MTALPLDAAALDRWAALLARITEHADGHRPYCEMYDDDLEQFIAQSRAALTLRDELAEAREVLAEADRARDMLASICKRTAVALKGPEPDMGLHDWATLPEVARKAVDELAECRAKLAQAEQERSHWESRGDAHLFEAVTAQVDLASSQANVRELREALKVAATALVNDEYLHADACPEDDTCECELPRVINAALARPSDDAALREFGERMARAAEAVEEHGAQTYINRAAGERVRAELSRLLGGGK